MRGLPTILTMNEAAERLRISRRSLQDLIKKHPHYAANGRKKLFSESDLTALWEAMRCHSSSLGAETRGTGTFAVPSEARLYSRARELTAKKRRKSFASGERPSF